MAAYVNAPAPPVTDLIAAWMTYVVPVLLVTFVAQRGFVAGSTSGLEQCELSASRGIPSPTVARSHA